MISIAKENVRFEVELDKRARVFFERFPARMEKAKREVVEAAGMAWADETKSITREENHIDTGLYINSIGYSTGSPSDPQWEVSKRGGATQLVAGTGSSVTYAAALEKRYALMARGLDRAKPRMQKVVDAVIKKNLEL